MSGIEEAFDSKSLKSKYVNSPLFDPKAFFFLTYRYYFYSRNNNSYYRSHAIGLCLVWPSDNQTYEIKFLTSVNSHRNKGVEECLLGLALKYCKGKQAQNVYIKLDEPLIKEY